MKKFLLLAGVALATLSANKTMAASYATVNVSAEIVSLSDVECTALDFGTITIAPDGNSATLKLNPDGTTQIDNIGSAGILNVTGAAAADCDLGVPLRDFPSTLELRGTGENTLTLQDITYNYNPASSTHYKIGATLNIGNTSEVAAGEYTGSFTLRTYY